MSHFESSFWDWYIGIGTVASILACAIFLKAQSVKRVAGSADTTGHVWDEDLGEYNNPLPRWWAWTFYLTIVFGLGYVVLYPALGSYPGMLGWTQLGELAAEQKHANAVYAPVFDRYAGQDVKALAADPKAIAVGQRLFLNHCAQCHASDGGGSRGFPSLTDSEWLWGGAPEAVKTSIAEGRAGVMPPFGPALGEQGSKDTAHYVMSLSGLAYDSIRAARGKDHYDANCVACHGAQGKGNPMLGAPDLTDKVWLHGAGEPVIIETIVKGRNNQMPAHKEILTPAKIHLLTAYVLSLSGPSK